MLACPALRPRRALRVRPTRDASVLPSAFLTTSAPTRNLSGLNHTAYGLSVYASQPGSPRDHATLDSGWWPTSTGRDSPAGSR
jgi:hypothetical protein